MEIVIRPYVERCDQEYFVRTEFDAAVEAGMVSVGEDESAARTEHRNELVGFVGESPSTGIFIAETGNARVGLVWVSERSTGEPWDLGPAIGWIYDIRVHEVARRQGLGTRFLAQADDWAKHAGYPAIGLHVFGSNGPARSLYASGGYSAINTYVQKDDLAVLCQFQAVPKDWALCLAESADIDAVDRLVIESFRKKALHTWPHLEEETIRDGYQQSVAAYARTQREDVTLVVRHATDGHIVGVARAYASSGDLGTTRYAWMTDLVIGVNTDVAGACRMLLGGIARWAIDQDLDSLRTSVHASETKIYETLAQEGFVDTNVFLRKILPS